MAWSADADRHAALRAAARGAVDGATEHIPALAFNKALIAIWDLVRAGNKYIDEAQPWALAKQAKEDEKTSARLGEVLYNIAECLRVSAVLIGPFMPGKMAELWESLGLKTPLTDVSFEDLAEWGGFEEAKLTKAAPLFPKVENGDGAA